MTKSKGGDLVSNRKAYYEYEILETYEAGVALQGTEVKSLRLAEASLDEAYVRIVGDELWLVGAYIAPYRFGNVHNHEDRRDRKLLMHHREIERLRMWTREKGLTIVPLGFYLKQGKIKIRIGRARGKKRFDKRAAIKERDEKRRLQAVIKRQH